MNLEDVQLLIDKNGVMAFDQFPEVGLILFKPSKFIDGYLYGKTKMVDWGDTFWQKDRLRSVELWREATKEEIKEHEQNNN